MQVRELRLQRGWSQEQLAEQSGISVRTIQRIEKGQQPGLASADALAKAFGLEASDLHPHPQPEPVDFLTAVRTCVTKYADFRGCAGRAEYWWFLLFVVLVSALGTLISETVGAVIVLLLALPTLAAGARRLHDTDRSGWWQLLTLVPFGAVVPLILLAQPSSAPVLEG